LGVLANFAFIIETFARASLEDVSERNRNYVCLVGTPARAALSSTRIFSFLDASIATVARSFTAGRQSTGRPRAISQEAIIALATRKRLTLPQMEAI
jgi:hypothetical protein